jgi:hypothetical protein
MTVTELHLTLIMDIHISSLPEYEQVVSGSVLVYIHVLVQK